MVGNGNSIVDIVGPPSSDNTVLGVGHIVAGSGNFVGGDPIFVTGSNNVAIGNNGNVTGNSNVAIGDTVNINGNNAIAVGDNTMATANDTTVLGTNAQANAIGSAAFGQGAVANQTQQQVFGTQANTYTMPGITSGLSKGRQVGQLDVATSDGMGNLATDGGLIFETLSELQAGIAISMAMGMPTLQADQNYGIGLNFGGFKESYAIGISALALINKDVFGGGEHLGLNGAFGVSTREDTFGGRKSSSVTGVRVGLQLSW